MTRHVVHSKALHNRKTLEMCLNPLPPHEAGKFLRQRGHREKAQLYMCLGGIPKYLEQVDPKRSLEKNLNRHCFTANGFFVNEFETLFKEQFQRAKVYTSIVETLAQSPSNLTELASRINVSKGGGFGEQIGNLVAAQFVREYRPVSLPRASSSARGAARPRRKRTVQYKLVDPFLIFYFRYIHNNRLLIARNRNENLFRAIVGPTADQYYGYAFERLAEDGFERIRERLGLALADIIEMGPYFQQHSLSRGGLQIDWLVVRRDNTWTLFEYKYSRTRIGTNVIAEMQRKVERLDPPGHVSVEKVLVAANGASQAVVHSGYFDHILTLSDLVG